jgi:hypothetical protein
VDLIGDPLCSVSQPQRGSRSQQRLGAQASMKRYGASFNSIRISFRFTNNWRGSINVGTRASVELCTIRAAPSPVASLAPVMEFELQATECPSCRTS